MFLLYHCYRLYLYLYFTYIDTHTYTYIYVSNRIRFFRTCLVGSKGYVGRTRGWTRTGKHPVVPEYYRGLLVSHDTVEKYETQR